MDNVNFLPEEYTITLTICLDYLRKCNVIFHPGPINSRQFLQISFMVACMLVQFSTVVADIIQTFVEGHDVFEKADNISVSVAIIQVLLKFAIIMSHKKEMRAVINNLGMYWRTSNLTDRQFEIKNTSLRHVMLGQKVYNIFSMVISWQYMLVPIMETLFRKLILRQGSDLLLPFVGVYPFSVSHWWTYIGVYALQVYACFKVVYLYIGPDLLLITLCVHLNNQFVILQEDLRLIKPYRRRVNEQASEEPREPMLRDFVKRHQSVIQLAHQLNEAFNKIIFINLLFAALILCFFSLAAKASTGAAYMANNLGAVCLVMFTMFVLCYCSEMLCVSSVAIAQRAYETLWYDADNPQKTILYIILMRSQKPCSLKSLNHSTISLSTFTKVLSTTWSYFSLVNTLYDSD